VSKLGYLLTILGLCLVGYGLTTQLHLASRSVTMLTAAEAVKHIRLHIHQARQTLKRFPNADDEFETLVLGELKPDRFRRTVSIDQFSPGSRLTPASFLLVIEGRTTIKPVVMRLEYFGREYVANPFLKGMLRKR
jgi:hypothetical protein